MLSAFTARPVIELRQRDKSKIETILAYGDRVLVGLNTGSLRIYRLNPVSSLPSLDPGNENGNGSPAPPSGLNSQTDISVKPSDLLREVEKFSTRTIEQLAIIKEANTLVSLSAYHVSLYDLQTYELIETLSRTKNATCFAVTSNIVKDAATGIPEIISRLAVAVRRRLLLWSWHESELSEDATEIVLPESIRAVTWTSATKLICGMNAGFVLVDIETSSVTEINGTGAAGSGSRFGAASMGYMGLGGYMPKPLAAKLGKDEVLLAKDINTLFTDAEGRPLDKKQVPWQGAPESIGYSYPYILALQSPSKGSLEVWDPHTLSLLQTLSLPGAAQLHFPPPTVSLAHAGKGFHISSERVVWKMDATDYNTQVSSLISQNQFDEAISVLDMLEDALLDDKTGTLREVKIRKAEGLFKLKRWPQSMELFNEETVRAPPERVLKLFPRVIAGELSSEPREETPEPEQEHTSGDSDSHEEGDKVNGETTAKAEEVASPTRAGGFSRLWPMGGGYRKLDDDAASIASSKRSSVGGKDDDTAAKRPSKDSDTLKNGSHLEGKDLKNAVDELLIPYLAGTRARLQRVLDPTTGKLKEQRSGISPSGAASDPFVSFLSDPTKSESDQQLETELRMTFTITDTALFRAYMYSRPKLAGSLFRIPNFCDPEVVNEMLLEQARYAELTDFLMGKGLHRKALTLLRRFGMIQDGVTKEQAADGGEAKDELSKSKASIRSESKNAENVSDEKRAQTLNDKDLTTSIHIDPSQIPSGLRGPHRTILYLQSLPPNLIDLILEYADWVLRADPDSGMEIFVADTENAETLPRDRVVKFLSNLDEETDGDLEIRYLEHIIGELGDATPDFHNRLVELLVKRLKEKKLEQKLDHGEEAVVIDGWQNKMERLVQFLRESRQYSLSRAFGLIPRDDPEFYEAQAVVLSNMGQHKQALEIYVFKMQDYAKAEEYCNHVHKAQSETSGPPSPPRSRPPSSQQQNQQFKQSLDQDDPDATPSIYNTLLSLYLAPTPPHEPNLEPALDLLSKHGTRLPATSALPLIPDSLPVSKLESYFFGRIRAASSKLAESRIVEGLRRSMLVDTQALLLLGDGVAGGQGGRNRRVVIEEERMCGVCHKRLGNSVVAVMPDNTVVHYGCLDRSGSKGRGVVAGSWGRSSYTGS